MRKIFFILALCFFTINVFSQSFESFIRSGNEYYDIKEYENANIEFRKALEKDSTSLIAKYNIANTSFKQKNYESAEKDFMQLTEFTQDTKELSKIYFNLGNAQLKQVEAKFGAQDLQGAIDILKKCMESYKNAMRYSPTDKEPKLNYMVAKDLLKKLQQQQQQQQNQENQDNQENQEDKKDENKDKQDENQDAKEKQYKISEEDAQRILDALGDDDKKTYEKVKEKEKTQKHDKEKDW